VADRRDEGAADSRLREVIDTIPALVHTGLPDGSLDFFNRAWLEFSAFIRLWIDGVREQPSLRIERR